MKSNAKNISLNSYDDIFSTEETREDAKREKVMDIPLSDLHPFPDHPFQVRDDDSMKETMESIKEYGVLVPAIVRPRANGGYELISGHRRKHACAGFRGCYSLVVVTDKPFFQGNNHSGIYRMFRETHCISGKVDKPTANREHISIEVKGRYPFSWKRIDQGKMYYWIAL